MDTSTVTFGKHSGIVEDNQDPELLGRLKVRVPGVLGEETAWALPCVPFAGVVSGAYMMPEPGTGVWVEFEGGDLSRPIWSGFWWEKGQLPEDEQGTMAKPFVKIIRSDRGLIIKMDDNDQRIILSDEHGSNQIIIEIQQGLVRIKGKTKVTVEAPQVELGENVGQPVVLGGELLQYLNQLVTIYNSHVHPGERAMIIPVTPAPPVPPLNPPTPQMLSEEVKTG